AATRFILTGLMKDRTRAKYYYRTHSSYYTLSLPVALPIYHRAHLGHQRADRGGRGVEDVDLVLVDDLRHPGDEDHRQAQGQHPRSEEHTSELQSRENLVCRLLLEKKKTLEEYCR